MATSGKSLASEKSNNESVIVSALVVVMGDESKPTNRKWKRKKIEIGSRAGDAKLCERSSRRSLRRAMRNAPAISADDARGCSRRADGWRRRCGGRRERRPSSIVGRRFRGGGRLQSSRDWRRRWRRRHESDLVFVLVEIADRCSALFNDGSARRIRRVAERLAFDKIGEQTRWTPNALVCGGGGRGRRRPQRDVARRHAADFRIVGLRRSYSRPSCQRAARHKANAVVVLVVAGGRQRRRMRVVEEIIGVARRLVVCRAAAACRCSKTAGCPLAGIFERQLIIGFVRLAACAQRAEIEAVS